MQSGGIDTMRVNHISHSPNGAQRQSTATSARTTRTPSATHPSDPATNASETASPTLRSYMSRPVRIVLGSSCALLGAVALVFGYITILDPNGTPAAQASVSVSQADLGDGERGTAEPMPEPEWMPDWPTLKAENSDIRAWMRISSNGTEISEPVLYPTGTKSNSYWLKHTFDGASSYIGTPFVDKRAGDMNALNLLVYGHHFTGSTKMFSTLNKAQHQSSFDKIGNMSWYTEGEGKVTYKPAFAMEVNERYQKVQRFGITDEQALRSWLADMETDATAKAANADDLVANAKNVVVTCTCASDVPNQPVRTLAVFVRTE